MGDGIMDQFIEPIAISAVLTPLKEKRRFR